MTRYGIQMIGMPAWGPTQTGGKIWAMVEFVQQLHKMTPDQYRATEPAQPGEP